MRILSAAVISTMIFSSPALPARGASAEAAHDPGPRAGSAGVGGPIDGLTPAQKALFDSGLEAFKEVDDVPVNGLGPRMNLDSCSGCHIRPAVGGSSPDGSASEPNPQVIFYEKTLKPNTTDSLPPFINREGPIREARFVSNLDPKGRVPSHPTPDGGVHSLFTIGGLKGAEGCVIEQPKFGDAVRDKNVIYRIPTPVFGAGLIEQIPDQVIIDNLTSKDDSDMKKRRGTYKITGHLNIINAGHAITARGNLNGNDGTISRFGWKAQNKSLLVFSGEAYNVEMGITNELFQTERYEHPSCQKVETPNDISHPEKTDSDALKGLDVLSDIEKFAAFMRFLAPPAPSNDTPGGATSIASGSQVFDQIGCAICHTPSLKTGKSKVAALSEKPVNLYSDIALHDMGKVLQDRISQGQATGSEFRTAPLWGLGQRAWFLHDGRTNDLVKTIELHDSSGSEASTVVRQYRKLDEGKKQDLLNFLRSL